MCSSAISIVLKRLYPIYKETTIDRLLESKGIALREDHKKFLIEYGGCDEILRNGFANFTFEEFKNYYLDESVFYSDRLPSSTVYFGMDFNDELLCIDNESGRIYVYYNEKKDGVYYESINDFLFFCFMRYKYKSLFFKKFELNVKIDNPHISLIENQDFKFKSIKGMVYYFVNNKIYELFGYVCKTEDKFIMMNVYEGGVLDI